MSSPKQNDAASRSSGNLIWQNERVRRLLLYGAVLLVAFMLGLVPMWLTARERDTAQAALRTSTLQNTLANAAIDARQGHYEPTRQAASLGTEIGRERDSVFNGEQLNSLRSMFDTRDDTITLLARSDPATADRLVDLYNKYRQALGARRRVDVWAYGRVSRELSRR